MWPLSQRTPWLFSSWSGGGSSCRWDGSLSSCSRPGSWQAGGSAYFASGFTDPEDDLRAPGGTALPIVIALEYRPVGATATSRVAKQLPPRLGVEANTMKTLVISLLAKRLEQANPAPPIPTGVIAMVLRTRAGVLFVFTVMRGPVVYLETSAVRALGVKALRRLPSDGHYRTS